MSFCYFAPFLQNSKSLDLESCTTSIRQQLSESSIPRPDSPFSVSDSKFIHLISRKGKFFGKQGFQSLDLHGSRRSLAPAITSILSISVAKSGGAVIDIPRRERIWAMNKGLILVSSKRLLYLCQDVQGKVDMVSLEHRWCLHTRQKQPVHCRTRLPICRSQFVCSKWSSFQNQNNW